MKNNLKVGIVDFWLPMKEVLNERLFQWMNEIEDITFTLDNPDLIFYSAYGKDHKKYKCFKIFYTGDNIKPDYSECDYSLSFYPTDELNFQLPVFVLFDYFHEALSNSLPKNILELQHKPKDKFCNFLYSNFKAKERIDFFQELSKYKHIDSPGKVCNNMNPFDARKDRNWLGKLDFISNYKFTIAFENEMFDYYTSEKIFHSLLVKSIPIYWGNKLIHEYFNSNSFINANDFNNFKELVEYVKYVDENPKVYESYFQAPMFPDRIINQFYKENIIKRYSNILEKVKDKKNIPVSSSILKKIKYKYFNN